VNSIVLEDKGYDSNKHRDFLFSNNNKAVIPPKKNRKIKIEYDKKLYKKRSVIETIFGKIKENRRLANRFEKNDLNFMGMIAMGLIRMFLRELRVC